MSRRGLLKLSFLLSVCGIIGAGSVGCAPKPNKSAWKEYAEQLRPEVGRESVETYIKRWGTPHQRIDVTDGEMYCWRISHGSTSGGVGYIVSVGKSYEAYDDIRLKFNRQHTLVDWTVDCIR